MERHDSFESRYQNLNFSSHNYLRYVVALLRCVTGFSPPLPLPQLAGHLPTLPCYGSLLPGVRLPCRITRVLKCLGEFGLEKYQEPWVRYMIEEAYSGRLPNVKNSLANYWIAVVRDENQRKSLYALLESKDPQRCPPPHERPFGPPPPAGAGGAAGRTGPGAGYAMRYGGGGAGGGRGGAF